MQLTLYDENDDEDDERSLTRNRTFSEISENQPHDETEIGDHEQLDTDWSTQEGTEFLSDKDMFDNDAKFNK